jgi:small RNA 2'-O-methyltransferase
MYGSFSDGDPRGAHFDAAVMLETIEHVDPRRLSRVERFVFSQLRSRMVLITTPNQEYNRVLGMEEGEYRHPEHQFEWTRSKFETWARGVAARNGYDVEFAPIGDSHPAFGGATQMAVFHRAPTCELERSGEHSLEPGCQR